MQALEERRTEKRIRFMWPLWFGHHDQGQLTRAQAVDLSRTGVSFTVDHQACPRIGDHIRTRFSFPVEDVDDFEMDSYFDWGEVVRVDHIRGHKPRVALRLHAPVNYSAEEQEPQVAYA